MLGDRDRGLFVPADIPPLVRDRLCRLADIITPNYFEFEWLCGAKAATIDQLIEQARALMARGPSTVVVTSAELSDTPDGEIETVAIERSNAWRVRTPKLPISPSGTGDLFAALLVSARVRRNGHAGGAQPRRVCHLRRAGAHRYQRHRGNANCRERRIARSSEAPVRCHRCAPLKARHSREKAAGRYAVGLLLQLPAPGVRFRCKFHVGSDADMINKFLTGSE